MQCHCYFEPSEWGAAISYAVNPDSEDRDLNVVIKISLPNGAVDSWPKTDQRAVLHDKMSFYWRTPLTKYQLAVLIDDHLAYFNNYERTEEEPF